MQLLKSLLQETKVIAQVARVVIQLKSDGSIKVKKRKCYGLNIVAVFGPVTISGTSVEKALLFEVGIGRVRPYLMNDAFRYDPQKMVRINQRRTYQGLTEEQYRLIAPVLFQVLQDIALTQMAHWQKPGSEKYFLYQGHRHYKSAKKGKRDVVTRLKSGMYKTSPLSIPVLRGVCFSFPYIDYLLKDLYWKELQNPFVLQELKGLAKYIGWRLKTYKQQKRGGRLIKRASPLKSNFMQLPNFVACQQSVSRVPQHLRCSLYTIPYKVGRAQISLKQEYERIIPGEVATLLGVDRCGDNDLCVCRSQGLAGVQERTKGIQVKSVRRNDRYVVFHFFHPDAFLVKQDDDLPF